MGIVNLVLNVMDCDEKFELITCFISRITT